MHEQRKTIETDGRICSKGFKHLFLLTMPHDGDLHKARVTEMLSISIVVNVSPLHTLKYKGHSTYPQRKAELQRK